jgi:hypothetical protein
MPGTELREHDSWRRRHPLGSRLVLYAGGLLCVAVVLLLVVQRKREDHEAYLRSRIGLLDVLLTSAEGRTEARDVLDREFRDPDLPVDIRVRVHRVEGLMALRDGDPEAGFEHLDAAEALLTSPAEKYTLQLERATLLQMAGRPDEARALVDGLAAPASEVLALQGAMTLAWLRQEAGDVEGARAGLEAALAGWRGDPDAVSPAFVGGVRPTALETWIHATRLLCSLGPGRLVDWERLLAHFPDAYDAHEAAALGLLASGHRAEAAKAWCGAWRLAPNRAQEKQDQRPSLVGLCENLPPGFQADRAAGR